MMNADGSFGPTGPVGGWNAGDGASVHFITGCLMPSVPAARSGGGQTGYGHTGTSHGDPGYTSWSAEENEHVDPDACWASKLLSQVALACFTEQMEPSRANALASIVMRIRDVREGSAGARAATASAGRGTAAAGEADQRSAVDADGRPVVGAPRQVPAGFIDAMLEIAMKHDIQAMHVLEPFLDAQQFARVTEFIQRQVVSPEHRDGTC